MAILPHLRKDPAPRMDVVESALQRMSERYDCRENTEIGMTSDGKVITKSDFNYMYADNSIRKVGWIGWLLRAIGVKERFTHCQKRLQRVLTSQIKTQPDLAQRKIENTVPEQLTPTLGFITNVVDTIRRPFVDREPISVPRNEQSPEQQRLAEHLQDLDATATMERGERIHNQPEQTPQPEAVVKPTINLHQWRLDKRPSGADTRKWESIPTMTDFITPLEEGKASIREWVADNIDAFVAAVPLSGYITEELKNEYRQRPYAMAGIALDLFMKFGAVIKSDLPEQTGDAQPVQAEERGSDWGALFSVFTTMGHEDITDRCDTYLSSIDKNGTVTEATFKTHGEKDWFRSLPDNDEFNDIITFGNHGRLFQKLLQQSNIEKLALCSGLDIHQLQEIQKKSKTTRDFLSDVLHKAIQEPVQVLIQGKVLQSHPCWGNLHMRLKQAGLDAACDMLEEELKRRHPQGH